MTDSSHHLVEDVYVAEEREKERVFRVCCQLQCNQAAPAICHSFDTKTAKYFLLVCNHVSLFPSPLADSLISHLQERGRKYNIINLLPEPAA